MKNNKIVIERHIGFDKKMDITVYRNGKLIEDYDDCPYDGIDSLVDEIKTRHADGDIEHVCYGELCTGGWLRWEIT